MSETLQETMKGLVKQSLEAQLTLWDATRAMESSIGSELSNAQELIENLAITMDSPDYITDDVTANFINCLELAGG